MTTSRMLLKKSRRYVDCKFKKTIEDKKEEYLESLSEGKDTDDYGSKVDALVDSMSVTDEKSPLHTDVET